MSGIAVTTGPVALAGDGHLALPNKAAGAVDDLVDLIGRKIHRQPLGIDARDEVALVDLEQPQLDLVDIDRSQRQPRAALFRQHITGAGETDLRLAVGHDDAGREGLAQALAGRRRQPGEHLDTVDPAMLHAVEAQRIAARGDNAVELGLAADKAVVGDVALCPDLLVEAQAGAPRLRLGLHIDFGDAEGDQAAQLFGALGNGRQSGEAQARLEGGERLLLLVVPVVVAADDKQRRAALDRIGRFEIGVVGARHRMVVLDRELALRQPQPG